MVGAALLALAGWLPQAPWDGLCDWAFTVTSALLVEAGWHGDVMRFRLLLAGLLLAAAAGVWRRRWILSGSRPKGSS